MYDYQKIMLIILKEVKLRNVILPNDTIILDVFILIIYYLVHS